MMDMIRGLILIFIITIGSLAFCLIAFRGSEDKHSSSLKETEP